MRLIDADTLMETIKTHDYPLRDYFNSTDRGMFTSGIKQAVDEQQTIDAVEVVHGHWINLSISVSGHSSAECSICGCVVHDSFSNVINYCPNCGAKMDGEVKSE